jgi:hypothetical protein
MSRATRWLIVLINIPQALAALALAVYVIWFAEYEKRNVGPSVGYTIDALLVVLSTQLANAVLWFCCRKQRAAVRFLGRSALISFVAVFLFTWIGSHFMYAGRG